MNDAEAMRRDQRLGDLHRVLEHLGKLQGAALQTGGEGVAFDVLEDEIVEAVLVPDVVQRTDPRMIERGDQSRLALEAHLERGVGGDARGEDFDRHRPIEAGVARPIDLAHPAGAGGREDLVGSEPVSWRKDHWGLGRSDCTPEAVSKTSGAGLKDARRAALRGPPDRSKTLQNRNRRLS